MTTRYTIARPLSRARLKAFVALDNLTQQMPLVEIVQGANPHARIWVAYNLDRNLGTYTAIYPNGRVSTITAYPGGRVEERLNRPADKVKHVKRQTKRKDSRHTNARQDARVANK